MMSFFLRQRPADADFTCSLADGGEHYVHNADTADEKRDCGDGAENNAEDSLCAFCLLQKLERDD